MTSCSRSSADNWPASAWANACIRFLFAEFTAVVAEEEVDAEEEGLSPDAEVLLAAITAASWDAFSLSVNCMLRCEPLLEYPYSVLG